MIRTIIVEDDPMVASINTQFAQKTLEIEFVGSFHNASDAFAYLKENPVDLILLDQYMPGVSGLELLTRLRREEIPVDVIMITAANDADHLKEALSLGVVDYLIKPFEYDRFEQAMKKFLLKRQIMSSQMEFTQSDIDRLVTLYYPVGQQKQPELQKGLQYATLEKIRKALSESQTGFMTADAVAKSVGLSRVTVRRYLNYLSETGEAESKVDYSTGGRPSVEYRIR